MNRPLATPPSACGIAYKEWAGVRAALERGAQTILLRKGGIAEGPGGFLPEHPAFWLYPTYVHEAAQGLKPEFLDLFKNETGIADGRVDPRSLALVHRVDFIEERGLLDALDAFHVWTAETVAKRFEYRRPGLWLLTVRVFQSLSPVVIDSTPEQAGCKTWVRLDEPLETSALRPVLEDDEFLDRARDIEALIASASTRSS